MKKVFLAVLLLGLHAATAAGESCRQLPSSGGQFGCSVDLHGNSLVIGSNLDGAGSITSCHQGSDGTWSCDPQKVTASDGQPGDEFGRSAGVDGNWLAVGAPFAKGPRAGGSGVVYLFQRQDATSPWIQSQKLSASDAARGDQFGLTLALSGGILIVGAPNSVGNAGSLSGAVYVFHLDGGTWTQGPKLTARDAAPFDNFGFSLAIDGTTIVVGAPFRDGVAGNSGAAYVFKPSGGGWSQGTRLTASDGAADDEFGSAVAVSGDALAVGARTDDVNGMLDAGSAYVYQRNGESWSEAAHFFGQAAGDRFGTAVSMSGNRLLVGALLHDGSSPESGAAYLFMRRDGASPWEPEAFSFPAGAVTGRFGQAVSIDGENLLVGAYLAAGGVGSATVCGPGPSPPPVKHKFSVLKGDGHKEVHPGEILTYSITVTNTGTQEAPAVQVTDTFSAKLRDVSWCVPGGQPDCAHPHSGDIAWTVPLASKASVRFTATATVRLDARGRITNEACAQAPGEQKFCGQDKPPDEITSPPCTPVNLGLVKSGPASAKPGQRITYTLTATNRGTCPATGVHLEDPIPVGLLAVGATLPVGCSIVAGKVACDLPDIAFPDSDAVHLQFDVLETCALTVVNHATVSANEQGPVLSNPVSTAVVRVANLTLTKTAPASVRAGEPVPYVLTVTNLGPDVACGVVVSDPIPAGLASPELVPPCGVVGNEIRCALGELSVGTSYALPVSFTAPGAACGIANTATVSAVPPAADPQPDNDAGTVTTSIVADLSITKTARRATASPGDALSYTIVVSNPGGSPAIVTDVFPAGLTQVFWCRDVGALPCTPSHAGDLHDVLTDGTATYRVQGIVSLVFLGSLVNTASVAGPPGCVDTNPGNNSATAMTMIVPASNVPPHIPALSGPALAVLVLLLAVAALRRLRRPARGR